MIAVYLSDGKVAVKNVRAPRPPEGYASIRLLYGGICNTDLELQRGYYGYSGTPGHEFVGEVVAASTPSLVSKRVVGEINLACRKCEWCRKGLARHCPTRTVLGIVKHPGAFREILTLPEANLHVLPATIASEEAVFIEPLAAACEILDQVRVARGTRVAVLGDGKLGLLVAQVLQASGAEVVQFGRHRDKLRIAEAVGVTGEIVRKRLPVAEFKLTVDATGSAEGLQQAVNMTQPRGSVVMKSTVHGKVAIDSAPVIVNEITLIGSRCGRFEPALRLLAKRKVQVDSMISDTLPLSAAPQAFAAAATKGVLKILLRN